MEVAQLVIILYLAVSSLKHDLDVVASPSLRTVFIIRRDEQGHHCWDVSANVYNYRNHVLALDLPLASCPVSCGSRSGLGDR